jgi:hypothetical protein
MLENLSPTGILQYGRNKVILGGKYYYYSEESIDYRSKTEVNPFLCIVS